MPAAVSGQHGHDQTFSVACALIQGFGLSIAEATPLLREYSSRCLPPWTESELDHKITDAEKAAPPPQGRGHLARPTSEAPSSERPTVPAAPLAQSPATEITEANQFEIFVRSCFEPTDVLSIAPGTPDPDSGRVMPEHAGVNLFSRDAWIERAASRGGIARVFSSRHGLFIRINPVRAGAGGNDRDVTTLRHVLVESDALPKPEQERQLRASGLPISALIDSGGKSIHAWIRVDARTREEFDARRERIWTSLPGFQIDTANKNPARFSRCPGGLRNDTVQRLLAVKIGAASYADWDADHKDRGGIVAVSDFLAQDEADPIQIIDGILFRGGKMVLAAPSKARKTWNVTDLAISVALGQPWCGFATTCVPVIYINLEIAPFSYRKRIKIICNGRGFPQAQLTRFFLWNRRGRDNEITELVACLRRYIARLGIGLIIIDPIYKTYGDRDENSNSEMAQVMNELERLAQEVNAAILIAAHFPKGNLASRDAMDRIAGASVFGRDPDTLLIMTPHETVEAYTVTPKLRDHPPVPEFVIQWNGSHFARIEADPSAIHGRERLRSEGTSYLIGSHRGLLATMPPQAFDRNDPEGCEVVRYIANKLAECGKDRTKALAVFHYARKTDRGIIVFDQKIRKWRGCDYAA